MPGFETNFKKSIHYKNLTWTNRKVICLWLERCQFFLSKFKILMRSQKNIYIAFIPREFEDNFTLEDKNK